MIHSEKQKPEQDNTPLGRAIYVFHHSRAGVIQSLKMAIDAYLQTQENLLAANRPSGLGLHYADSEAGPNTCLVITGFKNAEEIESFIRNKLDAPR